MTLGMPSIRAYFARNTACWRRVFGVQFVALAGNAAADGSPGWTRACPGMAPRPDPATLQARPRTVQGSPKGGAPGLPQTDPWVDPGTVHPSSPPPLLSGRCPSPLPAPVAVCPPRLVRCPSSPAPLLSERCPCSRPAPVAVRPRAATDCEWVQAGCPVEHQRAWVPLALVIVIRSRDNNCKGHC